MGATRSDRKLAGALTKLRPHLTDNATLSVIVFTRRAVRFRVILTPRKRTRQTRFMPVATRRVVPEKPGVDASATRRSVSEEAGPDTTGVRRADPTRASSVVIPRLRTWASPHADASLAEAAFAAGASLHALDTLVQKDLSFAGAWRNRLALRCAAASVKFTGHAQDETALRDAWHLRPPGSDPGPAGRVLDAFRRLASLPSAIDAEEVGRLGDRLGMRWSEGFDALPERMRVLKGERRVPPFAALALLTELHAMRPDANPLGWALADLVLAAGMGWRKPVPLLVAERHNPLFKQAGGRRIQPGEEGFERAFLLALASASDKACRLARDMVLRATALEVAIPKLRSKGAGEVVRLLLEDDCVSGTLQTSTLTRWGSRRLFERLTALGAVRELSGRNTFRLYGL